MKQLFLVTILILLTIELNAQDRVPVLEREISVSANGEPIQNVLSEISKKGEFVFSYSPEEIGANDVVSVNLQNKTVRQSLNEIFGDKVKYKVRGKYLIIQRNPLYVDTKAKSNVVEGYITESSGRRLSDATVYNKELMVSAVTDKYGYFKLELPPEKSGAQLKVSKRGYMDTLVVQQNKKSSFINMELFKMRNPDTLLTLVNLNQFTSKISKWLLDSKLWVSSLNISDTIYTGFQISFLPQISTNKLFSGNSVVNYSINILAGYNQEVRIFEIGGGVNMVRDNASNQFAGIGNIIGKTAYGIQAAGIFNMSKEVRGLQTAGIFSIASDSVAGVQLSGIWNETNGNVRGAQVAGNWNFTNGNVYGAQVAGTFNIAAGLKGAQVGGIFNIVRNDAEQYQVGGIFNLTEGNFRGAQVAGIFNQAIDLEGTQVSGIFNAAGNVKGVQVGGIGNFAGNVDGTQVSGIVNTSGDITGVQVGGIGSISGDLNGTQVNGIVSSAKEVSGIQISGIANNAKSFKGAQISGIFNKTGYFEGVQIGLINFADSCNGTSIGLLSFVKKGYHQLELSTDETFYGNVAFRLGLRHFYSILRVGYKPSEIPLWTYGYGFGTTLQKDKKLKYNIEFTYNTVRDREIVITEDNFVRLYSGIERSISKNFAFAGGLTFNTMFDHTENNFDATPYSLLDNSNTIHDVKFWIGGKLALRFF